MVTQTKREALDERELLMTRWLDAPPELVFRVWTQPEHLANWWGPEGFTLPFCEMEVKPGGRFRMHIRKADGSESYWMRGEYREVTAPERLVFTFAWEDEQGEPVHETVITATFEAEGDGTRFTFHQAMFRTAVECEDHRGGWTSCFDRLEAYVRAA
jgi:uncharacterized protein YndB with AHSA1/START domain